MFDRHEVEWQRQELARSGGGDVIYALISRELSRQQAVELPENFAARTAALALQERQAPSAIFEQLLATLAVILLPLAVWAASRVSPDWASAAAQMLTRLDAQRGDGLLWFAWLAVSLAMSLVVASLMRNLTTPRELA